MQIEDGVGPLDGAVRDFFERVVVPLVIVEGDEIEGIGTGTLISSSGVLLLAKHVAQHAKDRGATLQALIRTGEPHDEDPTRENGGLLPLVDIWAAGNQDVAFGLLVQRQNIATRQMVELLHTGLNLLVPKPGDRVLALGYQGSHGSISGQEADYHDELFSSTGIVTDVFREKRDAVMLTFPSFLVDGDFRPGMSGGPIFFDGALGVSAVICSGSDAGYATGALVWPAMGIPVIWGDVEFPDMLTFARQDFIAVAGGLDGISVEHLNSGETRVRMHRA